MLVPISWLKDYVDINLETSLLADKLNKAGVQVEEIIRPEFKISGVVAGKIVSLEKHPNASKLQIAKVDTGKEILQIVTGAVNIKVNDLVPTAKIGANLAGNLKIKKAALRGLDSFGMLCSGNELGLELKQLPSEQQEGVLILDKSISPGVDLVDFLELNDEILKFEIFANRPDCLSILGIAYEAAAILGKKVAPPLIDFQEESSSAGKKNIKVEVQDFKDCPRYLARVIEDVKIKCSDLKMSLRLLRAGFRSLNNIVDFTNYIMTETGHPLHAFDYNLIEGKKIIVRRAKPGETITTLDQVQRKLDSSILVIADSKKPIALAGVMGGANSEVNDKTCVILLESALFDPALIRRTTFKLGLYSQSSKRFEKGSNFHQVKLASDRVSTLISKDGGKVLKQAEDISQPPPELTKIDLSSNKPGQLLGSDISENIIKEKLSNLGFKINSKKDFLQIEVPSHRPDIKEEVDLIEEIGRLTGYDKIPETLPRGLTTYGQMSIEDKFENQLKEILANLGLTEVVTFGLVSQEILEKTKLNLDYALSILNPLTQDQKYFRTSIIPQLLKVIDYNLKVKNKNMSIFEISQIFSLEQKQTKEKNLLAIALTGELFSKKVDFYLLKGILEQLFSKLQININLTEKNLPIFYPNISCEILIDGAVVGKAGQIHPDILDAFDIDTCVYTAELDIDVLLSRRKEKVFKKFSRFPKVIRDISLIVPERVKSAQIEDIILKEGSPLIKEVSCFDVYKGKQIPSDFKSLAYNLVYQSKDRTLTETEVAQKHTQIILALRNKLNAEVRAK